MTLNLPNFLTAVRVLLIPIVLYLYHQWYFGVSFTLLGILVATDFFDGYFARKLKQETSFGAVFDPVADRLVALAFCGYFFYRELAPNWFISILLVRNFSQLMSIPILVWWLKRKFFVKPKALAKWVTAASDLFIFVPLFFHGNNPDWVPLLAVLGVAELWIFGTYVPRLFQIVVGRHDTFT